ncbi:Uncharacterised protein [Enterobacter cancerogenus]|uniref:Uncharacterized protein n=1 Tax=Enterobacter cancerogenus TaxID=69218 RepID=A0A484YY36_9ENTR|nr:Uncharacterised protein [Enterobacter cancerogenus]
MGVIALFRGDSFVPEWTGEPTWALCCILPCSDR